MHYSASLIGSVRSRRQKQPTRLFTTMSAFLVLKPALWMFCPGRDVHLLHKGQVQVVWAADAEIDDVHFCANGIVESVQEPRGVGNLQVQSMG